MSARTVRTKYVEREKCARPNPCAAREPSLSLPLVNVDRLFLTLPGAHDALIISEGVVRLVDQSNQLLVLEVPTEAIEETRLLGRVGIESGAAIEVRTVGKDIYQGYVEVVAESAVGRLYWCGADAENRPPHTAHRT